MVKPSGWRVLILSGFVVTLIWGGLGQKEQFPQPISPSRLVMPVLPSSPILDGKANEPSWQSASSINLGDEPALKVRAGIDNAGLWFALESKGVRSNDQVVFDFRLTEVYECFDEFSLFADGRKQLHRLRLSALHLKDDWGAIVSKGAELWGAEVFIPFTTLGLKGLQSGDAFLLKLIWRARGREWERELHCHLGRLNLLSSPDLDDKSQWSFSGNDDQLYNPVIEQGEQVIQVKSPARYSAMGQSLRLRPNTFYRLEAEVKGDAVIYLRARTARKRGEPTNAYTIESKPSSNYRLYSVRFPTGETGEALIIIGTTELSGHGTAFIRNLTVTKELQFESIGQRIEVHANGVPVIAEKVMAEDCRALRGFIIAPIDGRLDSVRWDVSVWVYNMPGAGAGVGYAYRSNDGLHITLADGNGVDTVLVRGGAKCKLYTDVKRYDDPNSGRLLGELSGVSQTERVLLPTRVLSRKFSFFDVSGGLLADVTFLRVHRGGSFLKALGNPTRWFVSPPITPPQEIVKWLNRQFDDHDRTVYAVSPSGHTSEIAVASSRTVHFVFEPFSREVALTALALEATAKPSGAICPLTFVVHDPIDPLVELMRADFTVYGSGRVQIVMDFPDQVLRERDKLWVSLRSMGDLKLTNTSLTLFTVPKEKAVAQALAYRKLLMKGLFTVLSEARPWTRLYRDMDVEQWLQNQGAYEPHLRELFETIDACRWLSGTVTVDGVTIPKDPLVRQYDEWVFRNYKPLSPFTPKIDNIPDAPEWAVIARQAWLTARKVAEWWLDNRLVPTGEFGGEVGDDSDMYQNYADLPMFEDGDFAKRLKDAARKLMVLAEQTTLEQGINRKTMDPLHAYEEGVNQESLLLWWDYGDPVAFERCLTATRSVFSLTVVTPRGHRHFRSQSIGVNELKTDRLDIDGYANPLMLHPAFEVAWYSGNPTVIRLLREWADGWLEHMKPGEYATSIEVATEKVVETANIPIAGGHSSFGSAMAFMFFLTRDERYIEPFMHNWRQGVGRTSPSNLLPEMFHLGALDKFGRELLLKLVKSCGVAEWLVTGDKRLLIEALKKDIAEIQRFWDMYTTSEPYTDRVFLYALTNATIAYTGGYASRNKFNHTHAVSWDGFGTEFAALVQTARSNRLKAIVYNFANKPISGRVRVWTLEPGRYRVRIGVDKNGDEEVDVELSVDVLELQRAFAIPLSLPPKQVTVVEAEMVTPLPPLFPRPDLALSAQEVRVDGNHLIAPVHNIGSAKAPETTVLVRDRSGQVIHKSSVPSLEAPLDLKPKVYIIRIPLQPTALSPIEVAVDPENNIAEIHEGNNFVTVMR
ncbi:MAG: CARDB domain-containing protein [Candidatus Fervidibacter sp.]|uniref:CARDB domain-containing protein n=1 Tax=Candidatus Fervidibacter sp. TaxID=3100871 RepID=UPI00404B542F